MPKSIIMQINSLCGMFIFEGEPGIDITEVFYQVDLLLNVFILAYVIVYYVGQNISVEGGYDSIIIFYLNCFSFSHNSDTPLHT